ncbi:MAG: hypothetical protein KGK17_01310 [Betaproteobacteria bacterium]|nr:hypothetical protein [Betaproteobacteria bacterium]
MKTRILASIIVGILATSAAQAEAAFSTSDLDTIYSGLRFRDADKTSHNTASAQQQQPAEHESTCDWRAADNDTNVPRTVYAAAGNSNYFAQANSRYVCVAAEHKSTCSWRAVNNDINVPGAASTTVGRSDYLAPTNLQYACGFPVK